MRNLQIVLRTFDDLNYPPGAALPSGAGTAQADSCATAAADRGVAERSGRRSGRKDTKQRAARERKRGAAGKRGINPSKHAGAGAGRLEREAASEAKRKAGNRRCHGQFGGGRVYARGEHSRTRAFAVSCRRSARLRVGVRIGGNTHRRRAWPRRLRPRKQPAKAREPPVRI